MARTFRILDLFPALSGDRSACPNKDYSSSTNKNPRFRGDNLFNEISLS